MKAARAQSCALLSIASFVCALSGCEGSIGPGRLSNRGTLDQESGGGRSGNGSGDGDGDGDSGSGAGGSGSDAPSCDMPFVAPASVRRLTDLQFRNSVHDVFGASITSAVAWPESQPNLGSSGLTAEAIANPVSDVGARRIVEAAEDIGLQVSARLAELLPCFPANEDTACAESFVDTFGPRAFRRPLEDEERALLMSVYEGTQADFTFEERIGVLASALLQMPQFAYVIEVGEESEDEAEVRKLTGYEIAARLSFLFWDSGPDEQLMTAAREGELDDADGVAAQARRLMESERAAEPMRRFFREWLHVPTDEEKDPAVYPEYTDEVAEAMQQELDAYFDIIARDPLSTPSTLLLGEEGRVNSVMAEYMGIESDSEGPDDWRDVSFPIERAGLLMRPAIMAGLSYPADSAPIHRGKFVLTRLLCVELPSPPVDALARQPATPPGASQRERSVARREVQECAGCHNMLDPLGLGLEELDGIGRYRTTYMDGTEVENDGEIRAVTDVRGGFAGAQELSALLARSDDVRSCAARQWLRYALNRMDTRDDACSLAALEADFEEANYSFSELFVAVTRTDAFRFRRVEVTE